jgi:hypothetical protein
MSELLLNGNRLLWYIGILCLSQRKYLLLKKERVMNSNQPNGVQQASPNYGPRAGCGPPYTFILPGNVINERC